LDEKTKQQIERGKRGVEVLKQAQYSPLSVEHEVAILYALTRGHLDDVAVEILGDWEKKFHTYLETEGSAIIDAIRKEKSLTPDVEALLKNGIAEFKKMF
jgi:F-type H+-transporting ATPase subunit alpha